MKTNAPQSGIQLAYAHSEGDWRSHLEEKGWCTVPLGEQLSADVTLQSLYTWIESANGGFKRDDRSTWSKTAMPPQTRGIFRHYIGHEEFMWSARKAARSVFADIWGTSKLVSSFDGACLLVGKGAKRLKKSDFWLHLDQTRDTPEFSCVQGLINLLPCDSDCGGLVVLEGSHRVFSSYVEQHPEDGERPQWYPNLSNPLFSSCRAVKVCAEPGDLVLWDSRTVHCNVPPLHDAVRACVYVSMVPAERLSAEDREKRIKAAESGLMTGHACADRTLVVNRRHPYTYGHPYLKPECKVRTFDEEEKELIGYV